MGTSSPTLDIIPDSLAGTLPGLFRERVRRTPDGVAYRHYADGAWHDTSWREMAREVGRWQAALQAEGLEAGDRVAIMLRNCRPWVWLDQAALGLGLVMVPLYTEDRPDNIAYLLRDSGARLLLLDRAETWDRLRPSCDCVELRRVVSVEEGAAEGPLVPASAWLPGEAPELIARESAPDELASIVYTSGTTGPPKGVMLSHRNMLSNAYGSLQVIPVRTDDLFLSFLPLSHTLERTIGYYLPMMAGAAVAYNRSIPQLAEDLVAIRPTILISVPRIYERVHAKISAQLEKKAALARWLFHAAVELGWARFEHAQGRAPWRPAFLFWPLLEHLVARKVLDRLGGRIRVAVCGGAALSPGIARVFVGLGVPIIQGYGLTETSPVITANRPESNIPTSIGMDLPGVEVRIGEHDELLARGPNVMLGYWRNEEATRAIIDQDGWLHSGDQVHQRDRHYFITGRLKEIIVMSNGEKVPPADMEMAIAMDPMFDQVMVVGEGRPFLSAVVVVNPEQWAALTGQPPEARSPEPLDERWEKALLDRINARTHDFPGYARIRRVIATLDPWSIDSGLMTPTMKIKRGRLLERYGERIEALYRQAARSA